MTHVNGSAGSAMATAQPARAFDQAAQPDAGMIGQALDAERAHADARRVELRGRLARLRVRKQLDVVPMLGEGLDRANQAWNRIDVGVRINNAYTAHGTLSVLAMVFTS
jgi:hypothetical protein